MILVVTMTVLDVAFASPRLYRQTTNGIGDNNPNLSDVLPNAYTYSAKYI